MVQNGHSVILFPNWLLSNIIYGTKCLWCKIRMVRNGFWLWYEMVNYGTKWLWYEMTRVFGEKGGMGYEKIGGGHRCSLTHFCSYKHTSEGDDLLITFVVPSSLPA